MHILAHILDDFFSFLGEFIDRLTTCFVTKHKENFFLLFNSTFLPFCLFFPSTIPQPFLLPYLTLLLHPPFLPPLLLLLFPHLLTGSQLLPHRKQDIRSCHLIVVQTPSETSYVRLSVHRPNNFWCETRRAWWMIALWRCLVADWSLRLVCKQQSVILDVRLINLSRLIVFFSSLPTCYG